MNKNEHFTWAPPPVSSDGTTRWADMCAAFHPAVGAAAGKHVRILDARLQSMVTVKDGPVLRGVSAALALADAPHPDDRTHMQVRNVLGLHTRTWQCAQQLLATGNLDLLERAQRMMTRLAEKGTHEKLDVIGLVNDSMIHPDDAVGGFYLLTGPGHGHLGQSTRSKVRHVQHLTKHKLAARRNPLPESRDVDVTTGADSKHDYMAATGHQPVMTALASHGTIPPSILGTDLPWATALRNPVD